MRRTAAGLALAAAFLIAGFAVLRDYGVNWDEALGDLFFGQRYLSFFSSFDSRYLDFKSDPYAAGSRPDFSMSPFRIFPEQYWPFANTAAMAVSKLLSPLLDPFDGFHAFNLLLGALFIVTFFRFLERRYSTIAAAASVALLFTSPRIWYDAMVNVKDFPEMILFAFAAMAYFVAWESDTTRWYVAAGMLWGAAMATKANAIFLPLIVLIFAAATRRAPFWKLVAAGTSGIAVFVASWPWLWSDPVGRLRQNLTYIFVRTLQTKEMTTSPLAMIALTTQPAFLVLIVIGIIAAIVRASKIDLFLLIWIGVVAARLLLPGAANFDVVRHFLELFPPLAALAGAALNRLEPRYAIPIVIAAVAPGVVAIARLHPFEDAYWNVFAGGLRGASQRHIPQSGEYWATSYRLGIDWLNSHAPPHSALAVPIAEQTVAIVAPLRLRSDIELVRYAPAVPPYDPDRLPHLAARAQRQPVYVMFIRRDENGNELTRACIAGLKPVARWSRDGVAMLDIYSLAGVRLITTEGTEITERSLCALCSLW
jgi:dolichyl-phosphate-mannose-protein mannosyltransferase